LRHLGAPFEQVLFRSGFLSDVVGVELSDGVRAVVKARPFQPRIAGCLQVQAALADVGFPCPEPLTGDPRRGHAGRKDDGHGREGGAWWESCARRGGSSSLRGAPRPPDRCSPRRSGCPEPDAVAAVDCLGPPGAAIVARP